MIMITDVVLLKIFFVITILCYKESKILLNIVTMSKIQTCAVLTVNLLSIGSGMMFAWTSPAIPKLMSDKYPISISIEEASYLAMIYPLAGIFFTPIFSKLMNVIGRKYTILISALPQIISWLLIAFANSLFMLYCSRVFGGLADCVILTAVSTYIGEIVEPQKRGVLGGLVGPCLGYGQFLITVIGSYTTIQISALISLVVPFLFVIVFIFMPESPYYYLMKNDVKSARKALNKLRRSSQVEAELIQLQKDIERQTSESGNIKDLVLVKSNLRAMLIAMGLRLAQQLSGITGVLQYTQYIFEKSGSGVGKETASILVTGLQGFILLFAPFIVDQLGRRLAMIISSVGCGVSLLIKVVYFYYQEYTDFAHLESYNWVPVVGMLLYILFYSLGFAIIPVMMLGELFSLKIKGLATSINNIYFSILVTVIAKMFQVMETSYGLFLPFAVFCVSCFLSFLFSYFFVPETKGKSLEEIQQMLKDGSKTNNDNNND